jgi:hypothetical protein
MDLNYGNLMIAVIWYSGAEGPRQGPGDGEAYVHCFDKAQVLGAIPGNSGFAEAQLGLWPLDDYSCHQTDI